METKHATLPVAALESTLDAMRVGDHGFTVPWAMDVDSERRCWLRPN
jgi:hypothetical protein